MQKSSTPKLVVPVTVLQCDCGPTFLLRSLPVSRVSLGFMLRHGSTEEGTMDVFFFTVALC
jgi:hypothetical protein